MGKAAEALDDVAVVSGVVRESDVFLAPGRRDLGRKPLERARTESLQREIFGVLERQVEERALCGNQGTVRSLLDAGNREPLRRQVLRECGCGATVDVARELVEHDDERNPAARRRGPLRVQLAASGAPVQLAEAFPNVGVVVAPVAEPHLSLRRVERAVGVAGAEPEVEHLLNLVRHLEPQRTRRKTRIEPPSTPRRTKTIMELTRTPRITE